MVLRIVKEAKKASEASVSETGNAQSFSWADKTVEERKQAIEEAEVKFDANIDQTDIKVDEMVCAGFIDEELAQDIIKAQEDYLASLNFKKPVTKIEKLEIELYGEVVENIEVCDKAKDLLRFVREKTYWASLMVTKINNIKAVDEKPSQNALERRAKAREKTPEMEDYIGSQPATSDEEILKKGRGKKRK